MTERGTFAVLFSGHAGNTFEIAVKGGGFGETEYVGRFLKCLRGTRLNEAFGLPDAYKTLFQIGDYKGSVTGENITYDDLGFEGIESKASTTGIQPVIQTIDTDGTSRYFDLQGRQLTENPAKGFYIKDGKKYLNK